MNRSDFLNFPNQDIKINTTTETDVFQFAICIYSLGAYIIKKNRDEGILVEDNLISRMFTGFWAWLQYVNAKLN